MASQLGTKYTCFNCTTRFYDLKKPAPICPKCGADQREQPVQAKPERKRARPVPVVKDEEEVELESEETDEDAEEEEEDDA